MSVPKDGGLTPKKPAKSATPTPIVLTAARKNSAAKVAAKKKK